MENIKNYQDGDTSESRAGKALRIIGMVFIGVIFAVLFALVFGLVVKWLWNYLMPDLFGLSRIGYIQAFAMVVLAKLLFGAFGSRHPDHPQVHGHPFSKWHDRFSRHDHMTWDNNKDGKYFGRFWQEEGEKAFEAYIKRSEGAEKEAKNE
ncbi:MAG: hypothetical protein JW944_02755 [Deltaproteobacteria bacterium]|nr:hypothetical protein [Deltaproteobacteria bacterium]